MSDNTVIIVRWLAKATESAGIRPDSWERRERAGEDRHRGSPGGHDPAQGDIRPGQGREPARPEGKSLGITRSPVPADERGPGEPRSALKP